MKTIAETQKVRLVQQFGASQLIRRDNGNIVTQSRKIIHRKNAQDRSAASLLPVQRNIAQELGAVDIEAIKLKPEKDILVRDGLLKTTKQLIRLIFMYQKDSQNQTWWKTIVETQVQVIKKQFGATQLIRRKDGIIVTQ